MGQGATRRSSFSIIACAISLLNDPNVRPGPLTLAIALQ
jgi:hypothetical protein